MNIHPLRRSGGYVISDERGTLPGTYATAEAAQSAYEAQVPPIVLHTLAERVCSLKGEYRHITVTDLTESGIVR